MDEIKKNIDPINNDVILQQLASLPEINYQQKREEAAKSLSISVTALDKAVKEERKANKTKIYSIFPNYGSWQTAVSPLELLNEIEALLNKVLVFPSKHELTAISLWVLHSYAFDLAEHSPILHISSPEKRCGKTTLLSLLKLIVQRALSASNTTTAAVFRAIEMWTPTIMIDEADTFMTENEELIGIINSGHYRHSAYVLRCTGDNHEPTPFSTWCPKVIAGIGQVGETIEDRSVKISLRRKTKNEKRATLSQVPKDTFKNLSMKCNRFIDDNKTKIASITPTIPNDLNDRARDNWYQLFQIAELAGGDWPEKARHAATHLSYTVEVKSQGVELLEDIYDLFCGNISHREAVSTTELIAMLCLDEEAPWATFNYRQQDSRINPKQISKLLSAFKIKSINNLGDRNLKGYLKKDFVDAFSRYVTHDSTETPATPATLATEKPSVADIAAKAVNGIDDVSSDKPSLISVCS